MATLPYGAQLPITYSLGSLTGTVRYVAMDGSDANSGTVGSPLATLQAAVTASSNGDSIVVRGGMYRDQRNVTISNSGLTIIAYPGELPIFNGAVSVNVNWIAENNLRYRSHFGRPVTDEFGIAFSSNVNLTSSTGYVGKHPDQMWVRGSQLRQVSSKGGLVEGRFWIDSANDRIYMTEIDFLKGEVEKSRSYDSTRDRMLYIQAANVTVEGIIFTQYSNTANDFGVITIVDEGDGTVLRNVEVSECAFQAIHVSHATDVLLEHVNISGANWMGVDANQTDQLTLSYIDWKDINQFDEFTTSPQSGAIKTSRCRGTTVEYSRADNVRSHVIWFDQSNLDTVIGGNYLNNFTGAGVFFEISDGLKLVNNYIRSTGEREPVQLTGSSGCVLVNNTLLGGANPVGVYTDSRSKPGCSTGTGTNCGGHSSDIQTKFTAPATLDWMPRIDMMINNILAYPNYERFLGTVTPLGFMTTNSDASQPIDKILHQENEPHAGLPRTIMDSNIYANSSGSTIVRVTSPSATYTNLSTFSSAMASSPVSLTGIEENGFAGTQYVTADGTPTSTLLGLSSTAYAVPTDADINTYIPAGTRKHGFQEETPAPTTGIANPVVGTAAGTDSSSNLSVPYPATVNTGDLLVIAVAARADDAMIAFTASGWTGVWAQGASFARSGFLYKIATGNESGSVLVSGPGVIKTHKMAAFAGVDNINPIDATPTVFEGDGVVADTSVIIPGQTPSVTGCMPVWVVTGFLGAGTTWTGSPVGSTEWLDTHQEGAAGRSGAAYYDEPLASTSATGTYGATPTTAATSSGVLALLRPAGSTVPAPTSAPTLSLISKTQSQVNVSASTVANAEVYEFQRDGMTVQSNSSQAFFDTGRSAGTLYNYRVRGISPGGSGPWSTVLGITTDSASAEPTGFTLTQQGKDIVMTCDASSGTGLSGYLWFVRTPVTGAAFVPGVDSPVARTSGTTYIYRDADAGVTYECQVFSEFTT